MAKRPCWVEISTGALANNLRILQALCRQGLEPEVLSPEAAREAAVELLAIVKADAYGHGLDLCAPAAVRAGARWLGVTSVEEGVAARKWTRAVPPFGDGSEPGILVIGGPFPGQGPLTVEHRLTAVVWEPWQLEELEAAAQSSEHAARPLPVHLELDTGMSRQGVAPSELAHILNRIPTRIPARSPARNGHGAPLQLDGLMTHLFAADERDGAATREQFVLLERMVEQVFAAGFKPTWLHVGNSAALLAGDAMGDLRGLCARFGMRAMVRPGLALYGLTPEFSPSEPDPGTAMHAPLHRVLAWKTQVVSVRSIAAGQVVGYNGAFVATEPMRLALLAVGYADGLKRGLSNRGFALVRGCPALIVGRISMDQTVVDVTEIPEVCAGDEVVLLGRQGSESVTAEDHARWADTIPWEIFTSIAPRVERRTART